MPQSAAALFDLDGVIIDSEGLYTLFWAGIDRRYPTGIDNFAQAIKGTTLTKILLNFPDELRQSIEDELHNYELNMTYDYLPGALKFLDELHSAKIPTAIVTSSDATKMEYLFAQHPELRTKVNAVVTGSMVSRSKPDPQGYLMAAEMLGRKPECCCVFEDSLQGLEAARRAGGAVVALATTNSRNALEGRGDIIIDSLAEIDAARMLQLIKA